MSQDSSQEGAHLMTKSLSLFWRQRYALKVVGYAPHLLALTPHTQTLDFKTTSF